MEFENPCVLTISHNLEMHYLLGLPQSGNFPIVCAVLALASSNYCCGEQGSKAQHTARLHNLLYAAEQCKKLKNKVLSPYVNP